MIDNKSANYNFPLPDPANELGDDVFRLKNAINGIDTTIKAVNDILTAGILSTGSAVSANFYGDTDPSTVPTNGIVAGSTWAHETPGLYKRRNVTNDGWIVEATLFQKSLPEYAAAPVADVGPIYVPGKGTMEWDPISSTYIAMSGGATGGGPDKLFYKNGQTMTQDYTIAADENAMMTGPVAINANLTVDGNLVIL